MNNNFEKMEKQRLQRMHYSFIVALCFLLIILYSFSNVKPIVTVIPTVTPPEGPINVYIPPRTVHKEVKPKPTKPVIPIAGEEIEMGKETEIEILLKRIINDPSSEFKLPKVVDPVWEIVRVEKKPELIKSVLPEYPKMARMIGSQGTVKLMVIIDKEGYVQNVEVVNSIYGLDSAAVKAVKQFRFDPAMQNDKPVRVRMEIPFQFKL